MTIPFSHLQMIETSVYPQHALDDATVLYLLKGFDTSGNTEQPFADHIVNLDETVIYRQKQIGP